MICEMDSNLSKTIFGGSFGGSREMAMLTELRLGGANRNVAQSQTLLSLAEQWVEEVNG